MSLRLKARRAYSHLRDVPQREETPVTVCIAAICERSMIVGASDRMLTAGDIQFEPLQKKMWALTNSVGLLLADNSLMQAEICSRLQKEVVDLNLGGDWLSVREIAEMYARYYTDARQARAERDVLAPLFLDRDSFIARQHEMQADFVDGIVSDLRHYRAPGVQAIITGIDDDGPHIYVATNDNVGCFDTVGFAAIGAGCNHANSQFMIAQHASHLPLGPTLLLTYSAKKRAEAAPGVGVETDMFTIGPAKGTLSPLENNPGLPEEIDRIYERGRDRERTALTDALRETHQHVEALRQANAEERAQTLIEPEGRALGPGDTPDDRPEEP